MTTLGSWCQVLSGSDRADAERQLRYALTGRSAWDGPFDSSLSARAVTYGLDGLLCDTRHINHLSAIVGAASTPSEKTAYVTEMGIGPDSSFGVILRLNIDTPLIDIMKSNFARGAKRAIPGQSMLVSEALDLLTGFPQAWAVVSACLAWAYVSDFGDVQLFGATPEFMERYLLLNPQVDEMVLEWIDSKIRIGELELKAGRLAGDSSAIDLLKSVYGDTWVATVPHKLYSGR